MAGENEAERKTIPVGEETTYRKEQLLKSKKYAHRYDLLGVLLEGKEDYTINEIENRMEGFLKKEVK